MGVNRFRKREMPKLYLVWPGDDTLEPQYNGLVILVPPRHEVAKVASRDNPGSRYRFGAVVDDDGRPIPGTVAIQSSVGQSGELGDVEYEFNAVEWADGVETNRPEYFARGFAIVESIEDIAVAMSEGRPKWEAAKRNEWQDILTREHQRRTTLRAAGRPVGVAPNESAIRAAQAGLAALAKKEQSDMVSDAALEAALGLGRPIEAAVHAPAPVAPQPAPSNILAVMADRLYDLAEKHGVNLTKDDLKGLMKRDEAVIEAVEAKLQKSGVDIEAEIYGQKASA